MKGRIFTEIFFDLPDKLANVGYWYSDKILSKNLIHDVLAAAQVSFRNGQFKSAEIGKGLSKQRNKNIRGDFIYWLDDLTLPPLDEINSLYSGLINISKRELFLPIKRIESAFSHYPPGTHYKKHIDRHSNNPSRCLTCVIYLSEFSPENGGRLLIYNQKKQPPVIVEPKAARLVIFDSCIPHEVERTNAPRWSLTTWLRDDIAPNITI